MNDEISNSGETRFSRRAAISSALAAAGGAAAFGAGLAPDAPKVDAAPTARAA